MSNLPDNLNDYNAWIDRGNIKEALDALKNQLAVMVADEPTRRMVAFRDLRAEQEARDIRLAKMMEQFAFAMRDDLIRFRGELHEEMVNRFDAYGQELDDYRRQTNELLALVEERLLAPFGEMVTRVETLEYGYADLADRVDAALDPNTPGATVAMVVVQDRVRLLTWLVWSLITVVIALGVLLIWHHWYIWERLR